MSAYTSDPRVEWRHGDAATVLGGVHGDWLVRCTAGVWTAWHEEHGYLQDRVDGVYRAEYGTCDEIFARLLGPATVPV